MNDNREVAKKLEELAKRKLDDLLHASELEEKQYLRETSYSEYLHAAGIRESYAIRYRQDGELEKSITEYLKSAEDFMQCGKMNCEDNRDQRATFCFDKAIVQYHEAGRDDLVMKIHNEYGQHGTKKQLNLGTMLFPLNDD